MAGKPGRPGASKGKKGPTKGTGGKNKRSLEGRGPTPKAEDRAWHPAGKRKAAQERYAAAGGKGKPAGQPQSRPRKYFLFAGREYFWASGSNNQPQASFLIPLLRLRGISSLLESGTFPCTPTSKRYAECHSR